MKTKLETMFSADIKTIILFAGILISGSMWVAIIQNRVHEIDDEQVSMKRLLTIVVKNQDTLIQIQQGPNFK